MNRRNFIKLGCVIPFVGLCPWTVFTEENTKSVYTKETFSKMFEGGRNNYAYNIIPSKKLLDKYGMKLTEIPGWTENNVYHQIKTMKLPIISPMEEYILSEDFVDYALKLVEKRNRYDGKAWNRIYCIIATLPFPIAGHMDWSAGHYEGQVLVRGCRV